MLSVGGCGDGCVWRIHIGDLTEELRVEDLDIETDTTLGLPNGGWIIVLENALLD